MGTRKYRKKPVIVEARELEGPEVIQTIDGAENGNSGDFVVTRSDGKMSLIKPGVFLAIYEVLEEIECQEEHVDSGVTGRTLAWAGAFSGLLDKLVGHPRAALWEKAKELKQTDGEGWVAGELLESICIYADAVDAQIGRVRVVGPLPGVPCLPGTCGICDVARDGSGAPQGDDGPRVIRSP